MNGVRIGMSTFSDGSMLIHGDAFNQTIIANRERWLKESQGSSADQTIRLNVTYDRDDYCRYRIVSGDDAGQGMADDASLTADALVTTTPGLNLFLPLADCVAAVFYSPSKRVLMLSHLGRQSLEAQGGVQSVAFLQEHYGVDPAELKVWLGPTANKDSYKIYALDNQGMLEATLDQLSKAGITAENIEESGIDTVTDPEFYSYSAFLRGEKPEDGRFAVCARLEPTE